MKHRVPCAFAVLLVLILTVAGPAVAAAPAAPEAPLLGLDAPGALAGRYKVVFRPDAEPCAAQRALAGLAHMRNARVQHRYSAALHGFAAELPQQAVDALRRNPNV